MTTFDHEAFWSARYRDIGDDYLFGTAPNRFLASQAASFGAGMRVLSVADGEGRNAVWLAEQGCQVPAKSRQQRRGSWSRRAWHLRLPDPCGAHASQNPRRGP